MMAFNTNPGKQQFISSAGQTAFTFNFAIFADTDLKVYKTLAGAVANDTTDLLTLSTHYTVAINGTLGGTVTLISGASLNDTLTIVRSLPVNRATDYVTNGDLYADTLDADQDYQTYLVQDGYVQLERAIIVPESLGNIDLNIPSPIANSYLRWNATADALENDTTIPQAVIDSQTAADIATAQANIATTKASEASASATLAQGYAESIDPLTIVKKDSDTGAAYIPAGTTAQRPATPANGYLRYNTDLLSMEAYTNGMWGSVGGGAVGGGSNTAFWENDTSITANYTITTGKNDGTFGPVTVADGISVTVPDGSEWSIV